MIHRVLKYPHLVQYNVNIYYVLCAGVFYSDTKAGGTQLALQLYAVVVSVVWSGVVTFFILFILDLTIGVRVSEEKEIVGMDYPHHKAIALNSSEHAIISEGLGRSNHGKEEPKYSDLKSAAAVASSNLQLNHVDNF